MTRNVGIWIDHNKAVVIEMSDEEEKVLVVPSEIGGRPHASGGSPARTPYGPQDAVAEDKLQRKWQASLKTYYKKVLSAIEGADSIYLLGPGQAKLEFKKHLERHRLDDKIIGIVTADKMTDNQVKANVRQFHMSLK